MDEGERGIAGVIAAERRRGEALVARDFASLLTIVAPDVTHTHTRGVTDDFDAYFRFVEQDLAFLEASRGPLDVRIIGDVAVMTGTMDNLVLPRGREEPIRTRAQALQVWPHATSANPTGSNSTWTMWSSPTLPRFPS